MAAVCVCLCECLAGSRGAWGSAMPPTVVYLGLVHAPPRRGRSFRAPCPSPAPLAGVLTLQQWCDTLVFHLALPLTFFLPPAQPLGFPDEGEVRGGLLSGGERQSTGMTEEFGNEAI